MNRWLAALVLAATVLGGCTHSTEPPPSVSFSLTDGPCLTVGCDLMSIATGSRAILRVEGADASASLFLQSADPALLEVVEQHPIDGGLQAELFAHAAGVVDIVVLADGEETAGTPIAIADPARFQLMEEPEGTLVVDTGGVAVLRLDTLDAAGARLYDDAVVWTTADPSIAQFMTATGARGRVTSAWAAAHGVAPGTTTLDVARGTFARSIPVTVLER